MARRRNQAVKLYVAGRRAQQLEGLSDLAGNVLKAYDGATARAITGLKRRAVPIASRAVRANYNVRARALSNTFRAETGRGGLRAQGNEFLSIKASARGIPLLEFGGTWSGPKSAGAAAAISKGARRTYKSAFITTIKGLRAIRVRSFLSTGRRAGRGPLRMLYGPSPFEMLSGLDHAPSLKTKRTVLAELTEFYTGELRRQFKLQRS